MAVTPLGVVTGILIGVVSGIIIQFYRHRLQRKQTAEEWYRDALGLISRAERIGHRTTEYQTKIDTETLRSKLDPLSEDLIVISAVIFVVRSQQSVSDSV